MATGPTRRAMLAGVGSGLGVLAGCTSSKGVVGNGASPAGNGQETTTPTPDRYCDTAGLTEVTVTAASPEAVRDVLDGEFVLVLSGEETQLAIGNGLSARAAAEQVRASDLELLALASLSRCLDVTCAVRSKVQFPKSEGEEEADVRAAFPDAVKAVPAASASGGRFWTVYSTVGSREEMVSRLEDGGFDAEAATIWTFDRCERYDR